MMLILDPRVLSDEIYIYIFDTSLANFMEVVGKNWATLIVSFRRYVLEIEKRRISITIIVQ